MSVQTERAHAKINLGLRILRRRLDGYRDIETVFHRIELHDDLVFEESSALSLVCSDPTLPTDETNLCMRAAAALRRRTGVARGARILLTKRIPHGAGLGGGSSDAAATLRGLSRLWNVVLAPDELASLALSLGSDVPFFLGAGSAVGRGRGEELAYFTLDLPYWIVLATPPVHVATAWAYGATPVPATPPGGPSPGEIVADHVADARAWNGLLVNDFQDVVFRAHGAVAAAHGALSAADAEFAQMSGSGSSVYGLFASEPRARAAMERLAEMACRVHLTAPHFQAA